MALPSALVAQPLTTMTRPSVTASSLPQPGRAAISSATVSRSPVGSALGGSSCQM